MHRKLITLISQLQGWELWKERKRAGAGLGQVDGKGESLFLIEV